MNKVDTSKIKQNFSTRIDEKRAFFDRVALLVSGTSTELTDLNFLCENYLTSIYVEFECLVSGLFHGYINNSNKRYMAFVEGKIQNSIKDKFSSWHASHTVFVPPEHIDSAKLSKLLDPTNWNITFKNVSDMKLRAKEWLVSSHAKKFSGISNSDEILIDAAHALRNCIAHNSESSRKVMNTKIRNLITGPSCTNVGLGLTTNSVTKIGKYLRANSQQSIRVLVYSDRIKAIGLSL